MQRTTLIVLCIFALALIASARPDEGKEKSEEKETAEEGKSESEEKLEEENPEEEEDPEEKEEEGNSDDKEEEAEAELTFEELCQQIGGTMCDDEVCYTKPLKVKGLKDAIKVCESMDLYHASAELLVYEDEETLKNLVNKCLAPTTYYDGTFWLDNDDSCTVFTVSQSSYVGLTETASDDCDNQDNGNVKAICAITENNFVENAISAIAEFFNGSN